MTESRPDADPVQKHPATWVRKRYANMAHILPDGERLELLHGDSFYGHLSAPTLCGLRQDKLWSEVPLTVEAVREGHCCVRCRKIWERQRREKFFSRSFKCEVPASAIQANHERICEKEE